MSAIEDLRTKCLLFISAQQALYDQRRTLKYQLFRCILSHERKKYLAATDDDIVGMLAEEFEICAWPVCEFKNT